MSYARIIGLTKKFGDTTALKNFNLEVRKGEIIVLLGPSGCGKTTLLRSIAGLERPDAGEIYINNEIFFSKKRNIFVPPYQRRIGMVFQNYSLWPHMNVFNNIAYPLRMKRFSKQEIRRRVKEFLALVRLSGLERRYPYELSGGQQQRVALARALVMEPQLLLLDEPLSNLDANLRKDLQEELKRVHSKVGITMIHVTHDQEEAMAIGDRIAVMKKGRLIQVGSPKELYDHPRTEFVARFIGVTNLFSCRVMEINGRKIILLPNGESVEVEDLDGFSEGRALLSVRPEDIVLSRNGGGVEGRIEEVTYLGSLVCYRLSGGGMKRLRVHAIPWKSFQVGERVRFCIRRATVINRKLTKQMSLLQNLNEEISFNGKPYIIAIRPKKEGEKNENFRKH